MKLQSNSNLRNQITAWSCVLAMLSLLFSKFLLTIAMIVLIANAVLNPNLKTYWQNFKKDRLAVAFTALFFLIALSYFNSTNIGYWGERLRVKLPFLILPFALCNLFPLPKKLFHYILFSLWLTVFATCVYSTFHFFTHYEVSLNAYNYAKVIWTPKDHIRFSLAVATCIWIGIYLYREDFFVFKKAEKYVWFVGSLMLVFYLHILSVRSGLVGFYLSAAYFIFYFAAIKKKWKHALVAALATISICVLAFAISPTIKMKLGYMRYDLNEFFTGKNVSGRSDAGRLMSQKMSWDVLQKNILVGVGMGDVEDEVKKEYAIQHPEIEENQRFEPHNEFLFIAVGIGIIGLILFFTPIFAFFFVSDNYRKWLLACIYIILLSSFFTEATLEMQIGTALFLFVILLLHYQFKSLSEL